MSAFLDNFHVFASGLGMTLALAVIAICCALPLGLILATMRISPIDGWRTLSSAYVGLVRNVPLTVLFFFAAFVLPQLGLRFSYFTFAIIALVTYYGPFYCEAIRSGVNSVPIGQAEAARAIGLSFTDCLRFVILPQAIRSAIPPIVNVTIALIKNTAIASAFGVAELLAAMERVANEQSHAVLFILFATAAIYLCITIPLGLLSSLIEKKGAFRQ
ncbi:amino acid ABC transporter permease (plasmid) [Bartonella sp. HY329]|uniref:amino acid ABC transporter permease n=1 Tax=unclassified Bartonella TaxID=2645622 RepID=UPI0021C86E9F|nr:MULTISPECIES: amino acid ABC transporter permease [unclassified Bartonella]UXM96624.1 amino acid ABC transporter permease [Bartonella sp. HY329]UXN10947.1 amino acid ABC transporter permease [Bartonella sp. HY328]